MSRPVVPAIAFLVVLVIALSLVVGIVLRPWDTSVFASLGSTSPFVSGGQRSEPSYVGSENTVGWQGHVRDLGTIDRGRAGFVVYGCASCHGLDGKGTRFAPMRISNVEQVRMMVRAGPGGMPSYPKDYMPDEDVNAITAWLLAQQPPVTPKPQPTTPAPTATVTPPPTTTTPTGKPQSGDPVRGASVYSSAGCAACHGKDGKGTSFAPALNSPDLSQKFPTDAAMSNLLRSGKGAMSPYDAGRLPEKNLADVVAYMRSLSGSTPAPTTTPTTTTTTTAAQPKGDATHGEAVYSSSGCAACHGKGGKGSTFAPALNSPSLAQKYATDSSIGAVMRSGIGSMGAYDAGRLSDADLADLIVYLRSLWR
ncbi:MAG: c-type cytochrome [Chloroflexi bacterium]|nr:c-type cytochrome [Chloroflexota bacterium]